MHIRAERYDDMILIGEKLNSSIPRTLEAMNARDADYLSGLVKKQAECGAEYLDINTALTGENELEMLQWVIELALANSDCGIMIDSPNPDILKAAFPFVKGRKLFLNSIALDAKFDVLYPLIAEKNAKVVCLPIEEGAIPSTVAERLENAEKLVNKLTAVGIAPENIYIDALAEAAATAQEAPGIMLESVCALKKLSAPINTICGLSNVSFGLPRRAVLNAVFLGMAMQQGLDAAILDVSSPKIQEAYHAANVLLGRDDYCMDYITFVREQE